MAETLNDSLEKLRKKSRTLLARIGENSKRVNAEVKKLRSETLSLINCHNQKDRGHCIGKNIDLWKLRNDSSEINAVLCPDYFSASPKHTTESVPNMTSSGKLTLTSKKPREQCLKILPRKPVKECYCYPEISKLYARSSRTQHKSVSPCRHCKSQLELRPINETDDKAALTSPISCETFRRVKKIDYTPRSQFLRNVQNKICELQTGGQGDCLRTCPRSSSYHKIMTNARTQDTVPDNITLPDEHKAHVEERQTFPRAPTNSLASERGESDRDDVTCASSKETRISPQKLAKPTLRKTIRSRKISGSKEKLTSKSPIGDKRATQLRKQDCPCCWKKEPEKITKSSEDKYLERHNLSESREQRDRCWKHDDGPAVDDSVDQEMENLRKFREQNYFETHGSSHTLTSSRSSGSLEQYLLNERLFPESVGKIHRQELVVTTPPCATMQRKRIHYFPRHVIRQEKTVSNTNYRRKRCQSCPLTGHAIDLGVLKVRPPVNSLALKYQKRAP